MRAKVVLAVGIGLAVMVSGVGTASAAKWAPSTSSGKVNVCFTAQGFDQVAMREAAISAAVWNSVSTNLDVRFQNCQRGDNIIPMQPAQLADRVYGETRWVEDNRGHIRRIGVTYDTNKAISWAQRLGRNGNAGQYYAFVWRQLTCHEMGHALGLPHNEDRNSCLQASIGHPAAGPAGSDAYNLLRKYGGTTKRASQTQSNTGNSGYTSSNKNNNGYNNNDRYVATGQNRTSTSNNNNKNTGSSYSNQNTSNNTGNKNTGNSSNTGTDPTDMEDPCEEPTTSNNNSNNRTSQPSGITVKPTGNSTNNNGNGSSTKKPTVTTNDVDTDSTSTDDMGPKHDGEWTEDEIMALIKAYVDKKFAEMNK